MCWARQQYFIWLSILIWVTFRMGQKRSLNEWDVRTVSTDYKTFIVSGVVLFTTKWEKHANEYQRLTSIPFTRVVPQSYNLTPKRIEQGDDAQEEAGTTFGLAKTMCLVLKVTVWHPSALSEDTMRKRKQQPCSDWPRRWCVWTSKAGAENLPYRTKTI